MTPIDGNAIVWCDGAFNTPEGKTAHGLVRFTRRYRVLSVIDSAHAGGDAGQILDGRASAIPLVADLDAALDHAEWLGVKPTHLVIGLAPDGGRLPQEARDVVQAAIRAGLNVDSGLHDFLGQDRQLAALAADHGVVLRDVRRPPSRASLHGFTGRIDQVGSMVIAVLGTDSAVGKRTTAWMLVHALRENGHSAALIGTGQTAWMQGAEFGIVLDSLVNDFVAGELENAVLRAWDTRQPDYLIVEGQGSLMNPAYPGGLEILAACRPRGIVLQHAPSRKDYDGFPGFPLHPLDHQIQALELVSGRPVVAVAVNHEGLTPEQARQAARDIAQSTGVPAVAPLLDGVDPIVEVLDELD